MAIISLRGDQLAARLRADAVGAPKAVAKAMKSAAHRGRALMVSRSPVDRGILRNAWKVITASDGEVSLVNDQPYAGVLERGARPFKLSKAGLEALAGWVFRKVLNGSKQVSTASKSRKARKYEPQGIVNARAQQHGMRVRAELENEAKSIAYAIAKKWEKEGKKGKFFIRESLPRLAELMDAEMTRCLDSFFNRGS